MTRLSAAHLTFTPHTFDSKAKLTLKEVPPAKGKVGAVITYSDGVGGVWEVEPAPFILTSDPKPPTHLVVVYDSTTIRNIGRLSSSSREAVAAYDDGLFDNVAEARRLYPNHDVETIAVHFGDRADWADTERGNMTPHQAVMMAKDKLVRGIYADKETWNTVLIQLCNAMEVKPLRWVADWTGVPHLVRLDDGVMSDACQYFNHVKGKTNVDISLFQSTAL